MGIRYTFHSVNLLKSIVYYYTVYVRHPKSHAIYNETFLKVKTKVTRLYTLR